MAPPGKPRPPAALAAEEDFPRGGGAGLDPFVVKQLKKEAYEEAKADANRPKKATRKTGPASVRLPTLLSDEALPRHAEQLRHKLLVPGARVLGFVTDVSEAGASVALPGGLRGFAPRELALGQAGLDAGVRLPDALPAGTFVRAKIVRVESAGKGGEGGAAGEGVSARPGGTKRRVTLSLLPSDLHVGLSRASLSEGAGAVAAVRSVEDHGYVIDFGIPHGHGFLPSSAADPARKLLPGSLVECVVTRAPASPAVPLRAASAPGVVAAAATDARAREVGLSTLQPGALVSAQVAGVLDDGVALRFAGLFVGTVDRFHLGALAPPAAGAEGGGDGAADGAGETKAKQKKGRAAMAAATRPAAEVGQHVRARVLYADAESKRVMLSLAPHVLSLAAAEGVPSVGEAFQEALVLRSDATGATVRLPAEPGRPPNALGFVHVSALAADRTADPAETFPPGSRLRARVIGSRPVDGVAVLSARPEVLEAPALDASELGVGEIVRTAVLEASDRGCVLALAPNLRGYVPYTHIADVPGPRALKRLAPGTRVSARVLRVEDGASGAGRKGAAKGAGATEASDAAPRRTRQRVVLTLKPSLVKSRLPIIRSLAEVQVGARAHGTVSAIAPAWLFVELFAGISGMVREADAGLAPGQGLSDAYSVGEVVKARVLGVDPAGRGLRLALGARKSDVESEAGGGGDASAAAATAAVEEGSIVYATVARVVREGDEVAAGAAAEAREAGTGSDGDEPAAPALRHLELTLRAGADPASPALATRARVSLAHLSDDRALGEALAAAARPGLELGEAVVLRGPAGRSSGVAQVSRKASLVAGCRSGRLFRSLEQAQVGAQSPGYVASVTSDAVFVRFLGGLTARAGLGALADGRHVADARELFREGRSVMAEVTRVEEGAGRFRVTLRPSAFPADGARLAAWLADSRLVAGWTASAAAAAGGASPPLLEDSAPVGSLARATVRSKREYGLVVDLASAPDAVGLIDPTQVGGQPEPAEGAEVEAAVLDVLEADGVVALSLKPDLVGAAAGGAARAPAPGGAVRARVELARPDEGYCVVSVLGEAPAKPEKKGKKKVGAGKAEVAGGVEQPVAFALLSTRELNDAEGDAASFAEGGPFSPGTVVEAVAVAGGGGSDAAPALAAPRLLLVPAASAAARGRVAAKGPARTPVAIVKATVKEASPARLVLELQDGRGAYLHVSRLPAGAAGAATVGDELEVVVMEGTAPEGGRKAEGKSEGGRRGGKRRGARGAEDTEGVVTHTSEPPEGPEDKKKPGAHALPTLPLAPASDAGLVEVAADEETVSAARAGRRPAPPAGEEAAWAHLAADQDVEGVVEGVADDVAFVSLSRHVRGRLWAGNAGPEVRASLSAGPGATWPRGSYTPGSRVPLKVLRLNRGRRVLELATREAPTGFDKPGAVIPARVLGLGGSGIQLRLSPTVVGSVCLAEAHDAPVADALAGFAVGQFVEAAVLAPAARPSASLSKARAHAHVLPPRGVALSLRPSLGASAAAHAASPPAPFAEASGANVPLNVVGGASSVAGSKRARDGGAATAAAAGAAAVPVLRPSRGGKGASAARKGAVVGGYISGASSLGLHISLGQDLDGRLATDRISAKFVPDPLALFPMGSFVSSRVVHASDGLVSLSRREAGDGGKGAKSAKGAKGAKGAGETARTAAPTSAEVGDAVRGTVTRVVPTGVAVQLDGGARGFARLAELSDDYLATAESAFSPGQRVRARVIAVDAKTGERKLGLKASYFEGDLAEPDEDASDAEAGSGSDDDGSEGESPTAAAAAEAAATPVLEDRQARRKRRRVEREAAAAAAGAPVPASGALDLDGQLPSDEDE